MWVAQGLRLQKEEPVALERLVAVDRGGKGGYLEDRLSPVRNWGIQRYIENNSYNPVTSVDTPKGFLSWNTNWLLSCVILRVG